MGQSFDHYIYAAHIRQWATKNRVTVLVRGDSTPKPLDVGRAVAAEQGLNSPTIEAAYGKVENAFIRALPRLISPSSASTDRDWNAVREYAVLMHDRYPSLRGSATNEYGLPGGNTMMVPNPAHWGTGSDELDPLAQLATTMDREELKAMRMRFLPHSARMLPPVTQVLHVGPMLLGDAGVHAITLHPDGKTQQPYVAMPLSPGAAVVFGKQVVGDADALELVRILNMSIAVRSSVVVDTLAAPVIGIVAQMWANQPEPSGSGHPRAIHVWNQLEDIP
jgi:hypothetical protein